MSGYPNRWQGGGPPGNFPTGPNARGDPNFNRDLFDDRRPGFEEPRRVARPEMDGFDRGDRRSHSPGLRRDYQMNQSPPRRRRSRSPISRRLSPPVDERLANSWDRYGPASGRVSPGFVDNRHEKDFRGLSADRRPPSPQYRRPPSPTGYRRPPSPGRDRFSRTPPRSMSPKGWPQRRDEPSSSGPAPVITTVTATVKEYVNSFSGILELSQDPNVRTIPPTAFFHASSVWVVNRAGNPYGPPVKYLDVLGPNVNPSDQGISLEKEMPIGCTVNMTAKASEGKTFVNFVAVTIWPTTSERPPIDQNVFNEKKQEHFLKEFLNSIQDSREGNQLVQATFPIFPWGGSGEHSDAIVWQIKDEEYGVMEVKGTIPEDFRFFALFHKDHIWLKDGKRSRDIEYFRDKPLGEIVSVGQAVTVSARSIVMTSGASLCQSILELQAIIVSLRVSEIPPSAPRPTMCLGGTGAYGMGSNASWFYFNQDLHNSLNKQLVTYLKRYEKSYPDIHPACLQVVEPKRNLAEAKGVLPHKLTNGVAQVREYVMDRGIIVENYDRTWRCLVPVSRILSVRGHVDLEMMFPMASTVHFNAALMDESKHIQYLATVAWSVRDGQPAPADIIQKDRPPNSEILSLFRSCNIKKPETSSQVKTLAPYFKAYEGTVTRLLDDNFGILIADGRLVLFDTCDVWINPATTADKSGKKLGDVLNPSDIVVFHAALIDEKLPIPYIASSVWLKRLSSMFLNREPQAIKKESIHNEKINIYKMVVGSVGHTLKVDKTDRASSQTPAEAAPDIRYSLTGVIRCVLFDKDYNDHQHIIGGVIVTEYKELAFFLTKHCLVYSLVPAIGTKIKINAKPNKGSNSNSRWSSNIQLIAISLFQHGDVLEKANESEKKYETSLAKLAKVQEMPPMIEAVKKMKELKNGGLIDVTGVDSKASASQGFCIHDEVPYSSLKCMITETSGVLESHFNKSLCYFELEDLNVELPIDLKDIVAIMSKVEGINVRYQGKLINDKAAIQYVAHMKGVQIIGGLEHSMPHVRLTNQDFVSDQPTGLKSDKMTRYRKAEEFYRKGKIWSAESILDGSYKNMPDIVCKTGKVKCILNENFALVYGPIDEDEENKRFCLFDVFDLYLSPGRSASETGKHVESFTPVETLVTYNACCINPEKNVPYLATSIWASRNSTITQPVPTLSKAEISEDKLDIYEKVTDSCAHIVDGLLKPLKRSDRSSDRSSITKARKDQLERVYQNDIYRKYLREVPKMRRSSRDPTTPDPTSSMSSSDWNDRVSEWKTCLQKWTKDKPENEVLKQDINDFEVTGTVLNEVNPKFCILELSNGSKALLHHDRAWLKDKVLFGDWRGLRNQYFRTLQVSARRYRGPMGVEFQVIFCHAGVRDKDFVKKTFVYPPQMKQWLAKVQNVQALNLEAAEFELSAKKISPNFKS